jgi:alpha-tubulin suppressor-like RCC1 family protein
MQKNGNLVNFFFLNFFFLKVEGNVYSFGSNKLGELGDDSVKNITYIPIKIKFLNNETIIKIFGKCTSKSSFFLGSN